MKGGQKTPDLDDSKYAGVVSRESVEIALTYATLHGVEVLVVDIRNAYLQAPTSEKNITSFVERNLAWRMWAREQS